MDAQTVNDITYENTAELTDNPKITLRDPDGNLWYITDHDTELRQEGSPFVLLIERAED